MKKTLLTVALVAMTSVASFAQGTINPLNGTLTRVRVDLNDNGLIDTTDRNARATDNIIVGIFWGAAGGAAETLAGTMTIGTTDGIMVGREGVGAIFGLQGAGNAGDTVSLEMRVISALHRGTTGVKQVALAPTSGPGTVVWGSTATASRFSPLLVTIVPEPSTIALGVLGLGSLLLFRRRK